MLKYTLSSRKLPLSAAPERIFQALFLDSPYAFWLDSSRPEPGLARFSFLGAADGPQAYRVESSVGSGSMLQRAGHAPDVLEADIFSVLERRLGDAAVESEPELPFQFRGGFVGYFGYELMAITEEVWGHQSPMADASLLFVDRFLAVDHPQGDLYLVALHTGDQAVADAWFAHVEAALAMLPAEGEPVVAPPLLTSREVEPFLLQNRDTYLLRIAAAKQKILEGESYEICLTNRVRVPLAAHTPHDLFGKYLQLRAINPVSYAAFLRFGPVSVLSSSPERFLTINPDGTVETKPIKGTTRRSADAEEDERNREQLTSDEKFFSENLMIVDLLRNDLSRSCIPGTVHVPSLMHVESYATVHQLVSTVRGVLEQSPVQCIAKCFPGGSMTGAPKRRTLEIIQGLEDSSRGIYSGAIGYLSLNGAVDLNIVIRTVVVNGGTAEIGVGGAIIHLSDADEEYDEMLLKAIAPFSAIAGLAAPVAEDERQQARGGA
jgi:para-aminobenzoate synthetase